MDERREGAPKPELQGTEKWLAQVGLTSQDISELDARGATIADIYFRTPTFEAGAYNSVTRPHINYADRRIEPDAFPLTDESVDLMVVSGGYLQTDIARNPNGFDMLLKVLKGLRPGGEIRVAEPFQDYDGPEDGSPMLDLQEAYDSYAVMMGEDPREIEFEMGQTEDGEEYLVIKKKLLPKPPTE